MKKIIDRLKAGEILVCDGAMGTSLQALGLEPGQAPEELNISKPDLIRKVHKGFVGAGCDMVIANTFGANPLKLKKANLEKNFERINKKAVELARDAAAGSAYILGDIGPTGEFLKPLGIYDYEEFYSAFLKQADVLRRSGIDAFIIETMTDLGELKSAVNACKAVCNLPVIANMTFLKTDKGYRTMMGVTIEQAVDEMIGSNCEVIGANCGCGSRQMIEIMSQFGGCVDKKAVKDIFLISQPNAGVPKLVNGRTIFDETPSDFAKAIPEFVRSGVNIIGGCCGTTPEHIREIARIVHSG